MNDEHHYSALLRTTCDRKQARKAKKRLKSACRTAHAQHKNVESVIREQFEGEERARKKKEKRKRQRRERRQRREEEEEGRGERSEEKEEGEREEEWEDPFEDDTYTVEQFKQEVELMRKRRMRTELGEDEREIRRLEAKLKKSKRKKKKERDDGGEEEEGGDELLEKELFGEGKEEKHKTNKV